MNRPPKERRGLQAALITDSAREYAVFRVPATHAEISPQCVVCGLRFSTRCLACMARAFGARLAVKV
jgi:hypothetical protein